MKELLLFLLIFLCFAVVLLSFSIIYPMPSTIASIDGNELNEAYFISKILLNHISPQNENQLVITEDELNGYISYRLKKESIKIDGLLINYGEVKLLDQKLILTAYGKYSIIPVKLEAELLPSLQQDKLIFTVESLKLSRIKIPKAIVATLYDTSSYSLPLDTFQLIDIENVMFINGEAVIRYEVDKEKIFEQIIKGLTKQTNS